MPVGASAATRSARASTTLRMMMKDVRHAWSRRKCRQGCSSSCRDRVHPAYFFRASLTLFALIFRISYTLLPTSILTHFACSPDTPKEVEQQNTAITLRGWPRIAAITSAMR
jgi:hypothetical protein